MKRRTRNLVNQFFNLVKKRKLVKERTPMPACMTSGNWRAIDQRPAQEVSLASKFSPPASY